MTDLNKLFMQHAVNKTAAAKFVGVSRATLAAVVAKDVYPAKWSTTQSERLVTVLLTHGALPNRTASASWTGSAARCATTPCPPH